MADSQDKSRQATRLRHITASRLGGFKVAVDFDPQTARASGLIVLCLIVIWVFWHVQRSLFCIQLGIVSLKLRKI